MDEPSTNKANGIHSRGDRILPLAVFAETFCAVTDSIFPAARFPPLVDELPISSAARFRFFTFGGIESRTISSSCAATFEISAPITLSSHRHFLLAFSCSDLASQNFRDPATLLSLASASITFTSSIDRREYRMCSASGRRTGWCHVPAAMPKNVRKSVRPKLVMRSSSSMCPVEPREQLVSREVVGGRRRAIRAMMRISKRGMRGEMQGLHDEPSFP